MPNPVHWVDPLGLENKEDHGGGLVHRVEVPYQSEVDILQQGYYDTAVSCAMPLYNQATGIAEPLKGNPYKGMVKHIVSESTGGVLFGTTSSINALQMTPQDSADIAAFKEASPSSYYTSMALAPGNKVKVASTALTKTASLPADYSILTPPKKGMMQRAVDSVIHGDGGYVHKYWGDLNGTEYKEIRKTIGQTDAGKKLLNALDKREVHLHFDDSLPPSPYLNGEAKRGFAKVYMRNTEQGKYWDQLDIEVDGMKKTGLTGLHEGLHSLGVGRSRRAEALVRLEELRSLGVPIDRKAMKQVLSDMSDNYDDLPWLSNGRTSEYFPDLKF